MSLITDAFALDQAPTDANFDYHFDGDLLIAPGHGSVRDGYLEFYPRTYRLVTATFQWASMADGGMQNAHWPPHEDPRDMPKNGTADDSGKFFELFHQQEWPFIMPESAYKDNDQRAYYPDIPMWRYLVDGGFQMGGFHIHRNTFGPTDKQQFIVGQSLMFWDLAKLPRNAVVERAEIVAMEVFQGGVVDVTPAIDWVTTFDTTPDDMPISPEDYQFGNAGNAFRGKITDASTQYPNPLRDKPKLVDEVDVAAHALPLKGGARRVRSGKRVGLRFSLAETNEPEVGQGFYNVFVDLEQWDSDWEFYRSSGNPSDAASALQQLPCLRVYLASDEEPDEPTTRHNARQVRAEHSVPRMVGRMRA